MLTGQPHTLHVLRRFSSVGRAKVFYAIKCIGCEMNPKKPRNKCRYCGTEVKRTVDVYCNNTCQHNYQTQLINDRILTTGKADNANQVKKLLIKRLGKMCCICKVDSWQGKELPVIIDHINGNPEDNSLGNLRLVCPNCDAQLPTYKSKNKGNGRFARRERYKLGKSC